MSAAAATRPATGRKRASDAVLEGAVDLARSALGDEPVGEHLGFTLEAERLGTHYFAATAPGYHGWRWYVTLSRIPRSRNATVCESGLLPGDDSLLAPAWLPWAERLAPGDVGPTDRLPYVANDDRLEPGWTAGTGDEEMDRLALRELGLGRDRVMNRKALDDAATRWYEGSRGPDTGGSRAADASCASCGFVVPLAGSLGQLFGVCANEWSPDDGKVVSLDHGCGAHSETDLSVGGHEWDQPDLHVDEYDLDVVEEPASAGSSDDAEQAPVESASPKSSD
ncbi:MAG TPA: DUF3027 domain-containing protein [Ruania sp.]|nr:DUF3027 domain-containing protein [Ruania sp.]